MLDPCVMYRVVTDTLVEYGADPRTASAVAETVLRRLAAGVVTDDAEPEPEPEPEA